MRSKGKDERRGWKMLEILTDLTILEVYTTEGDEDLFLVTDGGVLRLSLDADCCSESWFSDIYNFDALIGRVSEAREIELPDYNVADGRTRQEHDSVYGIEVRTDKGIAKIAFRNSSNGYYGGSLQSVELADLPSGRLKRIIDDWKA